MIQAPRAAVGTVTRPGGRAFPNSTARRLYARKACPVWSWLTPRPPAPSALTRQPSYHRRSRPPTQPVARSHSLPIRSHSPRCAHTARRRAVSSPGSCVEPRELCERWGTARRGGMFGRTPRAAACSAATTTSRRAKRGVMRPSPDVAGRAGACPRGWPAVEAGVGGARRLGVTQLHSAQVWGAGDLSGVEFGNARRSARTISARPRGGAGPPAISRCPGGPEWHPLASPKPLRPASDS